MQPRFPQFAGNTMNLRQWVCLHLQEEYIEPNYNFTTFRGTGMEEQTLLSSVCLS